MKYCRKLVMTKKNQGKSRQIKLKFLFFREFPGESLGLISFTPSLLDPHPRFR